jgi:D-glycero-D-manno-heptose 1,7-bisphosphate phosphatase
MVLRALMDFGVQPRDAFLVGDSPRDVEAAEAAGVKGFLYKGGSLLELVKKIVRDTEPENG